MTAISRRDRFDKNLQLDLIAAGRYGPVASSLTV
jgi:hypothetical protein